MATRLNYLLPSRLPQLPSTDDKEALAAYRRELSRALHEWYAMDRRAIRELDYHPVLTVARITSSQALTANTLTTVQFNSVIVDTHGWWNGSTYAYTPQEPGFYRCSWAVEIDDTAPIPTTAFGYAQLNGGATPYARVSYGSGAAVISMGGSATVECDGAATALSVSAIISAATAPVITSAAQYRSWFSIDYIGRRFVAT